MASPALVISLPTPLTVSQLVATTSRPKTKLNTITRLIVTPDTWASVGLQITNINKMPGDRRGGGHCRTHQMGTPAFALPALKITIGR